MRGAAVAAALIIAVLVGAGAGYFAGVSNKTTITSVSTSTVPGPTTIDTQTVIQITTSTRIQTTISTRTSANAASRLLVQPGLMLTLSINSTEMTSKGAIQMSIDLSNTLPRSVNVSVSRSWPPNVDAFMPPGVSCGTQNFPIGMAIAYGYYTSANLTSAAPFYLLRQNGTTPIVVSCPAMYNIDYYVFDRLSDTAYAGPDAGTFKIRGSYSLSGYWVVFTDVIPTKSVFHPPEPGTYTVIGVTEWGDVALLHFIVK